MASDPNKWRDQLRSAGGQTQNEIEAGEPAALDLEKLFAEPEKPKKKKKSKKKKPKSPKPKSEENEALEKMRQEILAKMDAELEEVLKEARARSAVAVAAARAQSQSSLQTMEKEMHDAFHGPGPLTFEQIRTRNLPPELLEGGDADAITKALFSLKHVMVDGMNITELENLELMGEMSHVYLQRNKLKRLGGLQFNKKLRFVSLADNEIEEVENVECLTDVIFLDLSNNKITKITDLPDNLRVLKLRGNPVADDPEVIRQILDCLPYLKYLDDELVTPELRKRYNAISDDEEEEDDEEEVEITQEALAKSMHFANTGDLTMALAEENLKEATDSLASVKDAILRRARKGHQQYMQEAKASEERNRAAFQEIPKEMKESLESKTSDAPQSA